MAYPIFLHPVFAFPLCPAAYRVCYVPSVIFGLLLPAMAGEKQGADIERVTERGRIDWTNGSLYATGLGPCPAYRKPTTPKPI